MRNSAIKGMFYIKENIDVYWKTKTSLFLMIS